MAYSITKQYVAGFFDGEGWVMVSRHKPYYGQKNISYTFRIGIESTDLNVLKKIQKRYKGNIYTRPKKRAKNRRDTHIWYLCENNALNFLLDIKGYLIVKKKQALLAIRYQRKVNEYRKKNPDFRCRGLSKKTLKFRENICQQIRKLNSVNVLRNN